MYGGGGAQYQIQRSLTGSDSWSTVAIVFQSGPSLEYQDSTAPSGVTIFYEVQTGLYEDGGSCCLSDYSNIATAATPPAILMATAASPYQINLGWTYASGGTNQFRVQRSPTGTDSWATVATITYGGAAIQYQDTTLPPGMTYFYRVQNGVFSDEDECCLSAYSTIASAMTLTNTVVCPLQTSQLQAKLKFSRTNSDQLEVEMLICEPSDHVFPGSSALMDICGVQIPITFDVKGHVLNQAGQTVGRLRYNAQLHVWELRASVKKGAWASTLSGCGLVDSNVPSPGVQLIIPVGFTTGSETFASEATVRYRSKANVLGSAK